MKTFAKIASSLSVFVAPLVASAYTFAAVDVSKWLSGIGGKGGTLENFITQALNLVISLSALVAVAILIYSGIMYITAAGDEGKVEKATKGIVSAIIGLVICFIAVLIVNFVMKNLLN